MYGEVGIILRADAAGAARDVHEGQGPGRSYLRRPAILSPLSKRPCRGREKFTSLNIKERSTVLHTLCDSTWCRLSRPVDELGPARGHDRVFLDLFLGKLEKHLLKGRLRNGKVLEVEALFGFLHDGKDAAPWRTLRQQVVDETLSRARR